MGCPGTWAGRVAITALALGCAGEDGPVHPGGPRVVVTEIAPAQRINRAPRFLSQAPPVAREGEPYRYGVSALDPDGDEVRFRLVRAPEGATLDGAELNWVPQAAQAGRPQRFTLRAADGRGGVEEQSWTVVPGREEGGRRH